MKRTLRRGLASATIVVAFCLAGMNAHGRSGASGSEAAGGGTSLVVIGPDATPSLPASFQDAPMLAPLVESGKLPPVAERLPKTPLVVDLKRRGREIGRYGGDLRSLVSKARDLRLITVNTYTRLVVYDEKLQAPAGPTGESRGAGRPRLHLHAARGPSLVGRRALHGGGFRYYFEDIANNKELSPAGPESIFLVDGKLARFEVLDERRVRYSWDKPNPLFLPALAQPRPVFICAPAHYLKPFHSRYAAPDKLAERAAQGQAPELGGLVQQASTTLTTTPIRTCRR